MMRGNLALKTFSLFAFILLSGCSVTQKTPYLSKKEFSGDRVSVDPTGTRPFEFSDCAAGILFIPVNPMVNLEKKVENKCGKEWTIFDLEHEESKFFIPILYGQYCQTVRGSCKKQ